jgi:hypothetical protein
MGESELKRLVNYKEPNDAYFVVLDPSGKIVQQMHGSSTDAAYSDAAYEQLRKEIQVLLPH